MHVRIHYTYADTRNILRMHLYTQATDGKTRSYRQKLRAYSTGIKDAYPGNRKCPNIFYTCGPWFIAQTKSFFTKIYLDILQYFRQTHVPSLENTYAAHSNTTQIPTLVWKYTWTARRPTVSRSVYHVTAHLKHVDGMFWNLQMDIRDACLRIWTPSWKNQGRLKKCWEACSQRADT